MPETKPEDGRSSYFASNDEDIVDVPFEGFPSLGAGLIHAGERFVIESFRAGPQGFDVECYEENEYVRRAKRFAQT